MAYTTELLYKKGTPEKKILQSWYSPRPQALLLSEEGLGTRLSLYLKGVRNREIPLYLFMDLYGGSSSK